MAEKAIPPRYRATAGKLWLMFPIWAISVMANSKKGSNPNSGVRSLSSYFFGKKSGKSPLLKPLTIYVHGLDSGGPRSTYGRSTSKGLYHHNAFMTKAQTTKPIVASSSCVMARCWWTRAMVCTTSQTDWARANTLVKASARLCCWMSSYVGMFTIPGSATRVSYDWDL